MTDKQLQTAVSIIPDSAPFNDEQRAWLNGFFAGMMGIPATSAETAESQAAVGAIAGLDVASVGESQEEDFPWHDDSMPMEERLKLAEGKPLDRRLMAAMAQLDCGACGYVCQTYSEAIASGTESNLKLCSPGGKDTAKMLKKLMKESDASPVVKEDLDKSIATGYTRANPFPARLIKSDSLNKSGSSKDVRHVEIDLNGSDIRYQVGDALGVYPTNCPSLVRSVISCCDVNGDAAEIEKELMTRDLSAVDEDFVELIVGLAPKQADKVRELADSDLLDEFDLLDFLQAFPDVQPTGRAVADLLPPLNPRLYSIASSPNLHEGHVHLTVGKVVYEKNGRLRKGVASTMLAERVATGDAVKVFVQPSHGFGLPDDPATDIIMVGPGTGIAPFMAFLQERQFTNATGRNWLFFGDQHEATDFLYRDQLGEYVDNGLLSRLDTAFSRDQDEKIYVQHRMLENGAALYEWLEAGASFYVCGDASRMAKDVDDALHQIFKTHGGLSSDRSAEKIRELKEAGRYQRDVY